VLTLEAIGNLIWSSKLSFMILRKASLRIGCLSLIYPKEVSL
jgi:hypothetical protein